MTDPILILSDSEALVGDIQWVFKDSRKVMSFDSVEKLEKYIKFHRILLIIADMDMELDRPLVTEVLEGFRDYTRKNPSLLFLASGGRKLELESRYDGSYGESVTADWLIKPFSRDALIASVDQLCG